MTAAQIGLRIVHILFGVFWVGSILFVTFFLGPAVRDTGPDGGKVMAALVKRGLPNIMPVIAILTIVSGLWLYWRASVGFNHVYLASPPGIAFGVGGITAIVALVAGGAVMAPTMKRMTEIGQQPMPSEPAARDAHMAELQRLRGRMSTTTNIIAALLIITVVAMAVGRYV